MITFKKFLKEARSNPDKNPHISSYAYLKQYKDNPDIYISFTTVDKIGINPKSRFNTPLGIYCYPLREVWDLIEKNKSTMDIPFGGDRPYIWIIENTSKKTFIEDMYKDYGSDNFDRDIKILSKIYKDALINMKAKEVLPKKLFSDIEGLTHKVNLIQTNLKDKNISDVMEIQYKKMLSYYTAELDNLNKFIEDFNNNKKDTIDNKWDLLKQNALEQAKEKNAVMSFWNLTRLMAVQLANIDNGIKMATKWNYILRSCGYSGFADKTGKGYIHPAEPIQAVFLDKTKFKVITKIINSREKINFNKDKSKILSKLDTIEDISELAQYLETISGKYIYPDILSNLTLNSNTIKLFRKKLSKTDWELIKDYANFIIKHCKENNQKLSNTSLPELEAVISICDSNIKAKL